MKKNYLTPSISVINIKMKQGIASGSASVTLVAVNGNTDTVSADWRRSGTKTIDTPF
ncbi:hypothetical protein [Elizabethkingia ursingii]|uniref:hypothetical protein n=1 Tax=Elizabethkingia ursingii TaxID=1756150 RepID=UPI000AC7E48F|nr:hypothetical protein [Elizabethkingia ursingii]